MCCFIGGYVDNLLKVVLKKVGECRYSQLNIVNIYFKETSSLSFRFSDSFIDCFK